MEVLSELMLNISLCALWEADLRRPWLEKILATDASPVFGFGVTVAKCTRGTARLLGQISEDPDAFVRFTRDDDDPVEKPRSGK